MSLTSLSVTGVFTLFGVAACGSGCGRTQALLEFAKLWQRASRL